MEAEGSRKMLQQMEVVEAGLGAVVGRHLSMIATTGPNLKNDLQQQGFCPLVREVAHRRRLDRHFHSWAGAVEEELLVRQILSMHSNQIASVATLQKV